MNMTETKLNIAAASLLLPMIHDGQTRVGPVRGGHAELHYAGSHKAWTATRIALAVSTVGFSLILGRKEKGSASFCVYYGNGGSRLRHIRAKELRVAQRYADLFNSYAWALEQGVTTSPAEKAMGA